MDGSKKKGVSFKLSGESIEKLEKVRQRHEEKFREHNKDIPIEINLPKTRMIELLIKEEYDRLFNQTPPRNQNQNQNHRQYNPNQQPNKKKHGRR